MRLQCRDSGGQPAHTRVESVLRHAPFGSPASHRVYEYAIDQFIAWCCSEPRLAFNRIVVARYRMHLESRGLAANTINQQLAAVRRLAHEAADSGLLSEGRQAARFSIRQPVKCRGELRSTQAC